MSKGVYTRGANSTWAGSRGPARDVFPRRVDRNGPIHPVHGQCWIWTGGKYQNGYGQFRGRRAHRVAFELYVGPIRKGGQVLHKCDTPACVRPGHLFVGTPQDNMDDKVAKGRWKGGTKSPCHGPKNGRYKNGRYCK